MKGKGQTALEYLLIIAGAIAIAAIAVYISMSAMSSSGENVEISQVSFQQCVSFCITCQDADCGQTCFSEGGPVGKGGTWFCKNPKHGISLKSIGESCAIQG
ncbi:MAG: class III signal peptide-containing protein, partial [Candidatus Diapherotrites archaeon]|nr:class III signal peptide-containing protein [Candidatus Diapherotrites archaeon]